MRPAVQVIPVSSVLAGVLIAISEVATYPWTAFAFCVAFAMWVLEPVDA